MTHDMAERVVGMWREAVRSTEHAERAYRLALQSGDYDTIRDAYTEWQAHENYEIGVGNIVSEVLDHDEIRAIQEEAQRNDAGGSKHARSTLDRAS